MDNTLTPTPQKKMNLWALTALVAGNMIGSGFFLLPAGLANIGTISLFGWLLTILGSYALALIFSKLSLMHPSAGGPYAFSKQGFGAYVGFQTAFCYWVAAWVGNAAIAVGCAGYMREFFPSLSDPWHSFWFTLALLWFLTFINFRSPKVTGAVALITTICKLIPIAVILLFSWHNFHLQYLATSFNVSGTSHFSAITASASLTLWAFIGLESAAVSANVVENPQRNIPIATLLGVTIAAIAYVLSSIAIMGILPNAVLAHSTYPFAEAARIIFGQWGEWFIAAGAAIACLGALNGWILLQGQVAQAAADDGLFPKIFAKRNRFGIPALGIFITSILITGLLFLTLSPNLVQQYNTIILVAVVMTLIPYLYSALAAIPIIKKAPHTANSFIFYVFIALLAALYSLWAITGSGRDILFYVFMLMLLTVPLYIWAQWE